MPARDRQISKATGKQVPSDLPSPGQLVEEGMRTGLFLACCLVALSVPSYAQNTRDAELADSDAKLNETYNRLVKQLGRDEQTALRVAQRAWISFRDLDCQVGWGDPRDCLITRTDEREQQLRDSIYWTPAGKRIDLPAPRD